MPSIDDILARFADRCPTPRALLARDKLPTPTCRGGKCGAGNRCDVCTALENYLTIVYRRIDKAARVLRWARECVTVFPDETRDLLAPIILDILEQYQE